MDCSALPLTVLWWRQCICVDYGCCINDGQRGVAAAPKGGRHCFGRGGAFLSGWQESIIIHSLKSVQNIINSDKHCFELYGFDILIDDNLKPWLVEVNASPSLTASTYCDRVMKHTIIQDVMKVVIQVGALRVLCLAGASHGTSA